MIKKSIQKLQKKSKGIFLKSLLGILVASLFVPVFTYTAPTAQAVTCSNPNGWTNKKEVRTSKNTVAWEEKFDLFMAVYVSEEVYNQCKAEIVRDYKFSYYVYHTLVPGIPTVPALGYINTPLRETIIPTKIGNEYAFAFYKPDLTLKAINTSTVLNWTPTSREPFTIFGYFALGDARDSWFAINFKGLQYNDDLPEHPVTDPNIPKIEASQTQNYGEQGIEFDAIKYQVGIQSDGMDGSKYRNFLRLTFADGGWIALPDLKASEGQGGGPGTGSTSYISNPFGVNTAHAQATSSTPPATSSSTTTTDTPKGFSTKLVPLSSAKVVFNMLITQPDGIQWGGSKPTYISYSKLAGTFPTVQYLTSNSHKVSGLSLIAVEKARAQDTAVCGPVKILPQQIACSGSKVVEINPNPAITSLSKDKAPFPLQSLGSALQTAGVGTTSEKVYNVLVYPTLDLSLDWTQLVANPVVGIGQGILNPYGFSYNGNPQSIFVQVYSSKAELEKHKNDPPPAEVTPYEEKIAEATTNSGNGVGDLFNFLRKVISYLVLLMTSIIYWIFSIILVPILKALLHIKPYQDQFVNFIYPGWIIVRNIANIGFILALLWMGLRTLFQAEDSGKTRGFILWLVLMALLVNFSLVIGQGIVGIADTVQSQFLPEGTRVIEALGQKLMVDPIKQFRGEGLTDSSGNFSVDSSASDVTKPIVLLILAIAAFFSFVALIAFILVRLVALWILYMLSPLAYVAKILPETKKYWDQWWSEFIKYAFTVPILAFFLNIAALMATTFAKNSGDTVIAGRDPNYFFGGAAKEITEFAITTISHFIVLAFLFIGMKFAASSGTFGAKQIVDGAKKGFDFVTKTVPQYAGKGALAAGRWAKDTGSDTLANSKMLRGKPGLQKAILGAARPIQAAKAIKKGYFDNPKEEMEKRFTDQFGKLTDKIQPWGENKLFPAKMAYWKLMGQDSKALMSKAEERKRFTEIRNDADMGKMATDLSKNERYQRALNIGRVDLEMADNNLNDIKGKLNAAIAADAQNSTKGSVKKVRDLTAEERTLRNAIGNARTAGASDIDVNDMGKDFNRNLPATINKLEADISDAKVTLTNDSATRAALGFTGTMDDETRKGIMKESSDLATEAQRRERPFSNALADKEESEAREKQKNLGELDYDQLENGFNKAIAENNIAAARAHFKQMADNGVLDKLLKSNKKKDGSSYKNNVQDLSQFVKDKFGKVSGKSQINIIREVSNSSEKNGNLALSNAVKSLGNGGGILNTITQQQQILETKKVKDVTDWKKGDVTHTDELGVEQFNAKIKEKLRSYDTAEKAKNLRQKIDRPIADHILSKFEARPADINSIGNHVASALVEVASPNVASKFKPHLVV